MFEIGSLPLGEEDSDGENMEEEEGVSLTDPGTVVWVLWGRRWYPAKVVNLVDIPDSVRTSLRKDDGKSSVVKFYEEDTFARIDAKKIEELGHSSIDLKRSRFPGILQKYHLALSDLKYNI